MSGRVIALFLSVARDLRGLPARTNWVSEVLSGHSIFECERNNFSTGFKPINLYISHWKTYRRYTTYTESGSWCSSSLSGWPCRALWAALLTSWELSLFSTDFKAAADWGEVDVNSTRSKTSSSSSPMMIRAHSGVKPSSLILIIQSFPQLDTLWPRWRYINSLRRETSPITHLSTSITSSSVCCCSSYSAGVLLTEVL